MLLSICPPDQVEACVDDMPMGTNLRVVWTRSVEAILAKKVFCKYQPPDGVITGQCEGGFMGKVSLQSDTAFMMHFVQD